MKNLFARLSLVGALLAAPQAVAQIAPGSVPMTIGSTPVIGSVSGDCLAVLNGKLAQVPGCGGASPGLIVGTTPISGGSAGRILYDNGGTTLGEYTVSGSGTSVPLLTSPIFVTDITTPVAKLSGTSNQLIFQSGGVTGTLSWAPASTNKTITLPNGTTDFTATGGSSQFLKQSTVGAAITVVRPTCSDLSDAGTGCTATIASYLPLAGGTMTGGIGFSTTNTLDIGTSATVLAPRTVYAGTSFVGPAGNFTTSVTSPLSIGGSGTTGTQKTFQTTTGNGTTDQFAFVGGNNGGTSFGTWKAANLNVASAGSAAAPSLTVGNATTGLYSVSTTGIGMAVNGALKYDFGITNGGTTIGSSTLVQGGVTANAGLTVGATTGNSVISHAAATRLLLGTDGVMTLTNQAATNSVIITFPTATATPTFQLGAGDQASDAPIAQTLRVQSAASGTTTTPKNFTIIGALAFGAAQSGDIIIQTGKYSSNQAAPTTAMTIKGETQAVVVAGTLSATLTQTTEANMLCYNSGTGLMTYSTVAQQCTVSSARFKDGVSPLAQQRALDVVTALNPVSFVYRPDADLGSDRHLGLIAEQVAEVAPELVVYEHDGTTPKAVKYGEMSPIIIAAIKQLRADNDNLRRDVESLRRAGR